MDAKQTIKAVQDVPLAFQVCLGIGHMLCLPLFIVAVIDAAVTLSSSRNSDFSFIPLMLAGLFLAAHAAATYFGVKKGWVQLSPNEESKTGE